MATDDKNEITDEVKVDLTGDAVEPDHERYLAQQELLVVAEAERIAEVEARRLPDRPAESASKPTWLDYCVPLGADRTDLENDTEYNVTGRGEEADILGTYQSKPYTLNELIALADRLGG